MAKRSRQTRRVHIDGLEWTYQIGSGFVSIRDPDGKRTVIDRNEIQPVCPSSGEYLDFLTPQVVKDFIWKKLHPVRKLTQPVGTADAKDQVINLFCGARKHVPSYYDRNGRRRFAGAQE